LEVSRDRRKPSAKIDLAPFAAVRASDLATERHQLEAYRWSSQARLPTLLGTGRDSASGLRSCRGFYGAAARYRREIMRMAGTPEDLARCGMRIAYDHEATGKTP
jgi:hypothetical protein